MGFSICVAVYVSLSYLPRLLLSYLFAVGIRYLNLSTINLGDIRTSFFIPVLFLFSYCSNVLAFSFSDMPSFSCVLYLKPVSFPFIMVGLLDFPALLVYYDVMSCVGFQTDSTEAPYMTYLFTLTSGCNLSCFQDHRKIRFPQIHSGFN